MKKIIIAFVFCAFVSYANSQDVQKWKITDIEKLMQVNKDSGDILVINFWATFCKPCVAEIPSFINVTNKYKAHGKDLNAVDVKLHLVSLDLPAAFPAKIAAFAKEKKFNAALSWLEETNADYFCPKIDTSWSGSIPATLIINTRTGNRQFTEGEMTAREFELKLRAVMNGDKAVPGGPAMIKTGDADSKD
ncbi:MAG: TlpA disulfide reductase family protein [Ferruginibacter sp.]